MCKSRERKNNLSLNFDFSKFSRTLFLALFVVFGVMSFSSQAQASTYYVDSSVTDTNVGTFI